VTGESQAVPIIPFLMSANDAGIISALIFIASSIILGIPVFANRGMAQLAWLGAVSFILLIELALMITFVVLISTGEIHPEF
jgi:hypothetical protein